MPGFLDKSEPGESVEVPPEELMRLSYWRDNFCYTTPIHGYSFLPRSLHWYERSMWLALILICTIVCVKDIISLVIVFNSEPTGSIVQIQVNKTLNFPSSAVCFEVATQALVLPNVQDTLALLNSFTPKMSDLLDFNRTLGVEMSQSLLYLTYSMLVESVRCEQKDCVDRPKNKLDISSVNSQDERYWRMSLTYDYYAKRHVPFDRLLQAIGGKICHQMNGKISHRKFDTDGNELLSESSFCHPENVVYMGLVAGQKETICIKLGQSEVTFNSTTETMKVEMAMADFYQINNDTQQFVMCTNMFFDLSGGQEVLDFTRGDSYITVPIETSMTASVEIAANYITYNMKRKACSTGDTRFVCENSCKSSFVQQNYNCRLLSYANLIPGSQNGNLQICSPFNNSRPGQISRDLKEGKETMSPCRALCIQECQMVDYLFLQNTMNQNSFSTSNVGLTTLVIYGRKFRYPIITEFPTMQWPEFLASFGGSIGFYIGGSILAFVHVPLYLIHMGVYYFRRWLRCCGKADQGGFSQPIQVKPNRISYSSTSNPNGISVY